MTNLEKHRFQLHAGKDNYPDLNNLIAAFPTLELALSHVLPGAKNWGRRNVTIGGTTYNWFYILDCETLKEVANELPKEAYDPKEYGRPQKATK